MKRIMVSLVVLTLFGCMSERKKCNPEQLPFAESKLESDLIGHTINRGDLVVWSFDDSNDEIHVTCRHCYHATKGFEVHATVLAYKDNWTKYISGPVMMEYKLDGKEWKLKEVRGMIDLKIHDVK